MMRSVLRVVLVALVGLLFGCPTPSLADSSADVSPVATPAYDGHCHSTATTTTTTERGPPGCEYINTDAADDADDHGSRHFGVLQRRHTRAATTNSTTLNWRNY